MKPRLIWLTSIFLAACALAPSDDNTPAGTFHYVLEWDWEGAEEQDGARIFTTALGYRVGIEAAYVGSASLELVPCASSTAGRSPLFFNTPTAYAEHSYTSDGSYTVIGRNESLLAAQPSRNVASYLDHTYCRLHYLIASNDGLADDGTVLERTSARLQGWYTSGDNEPVPFDGSISLRGGSLVDLPDESFLEDGQEVILTRYPARSLDRADLANLTPQELAFELLKGIARTSTVRIR